MCTSLTEWLPKKTHVTARGECCGHGVQTTIVLRGSEDARHLNLLPDIRAPQTQTIPHQKTNLGQRKTLCLPTGKLLFGVLDLSAMEGRSAHRCSSSNHDVFSFGSTTKRSTTTLRELGVDQRSLLEELRPFWNIMRPVSKCLDT